MLTYKNVDKNCKINNMIQFTDIEAKPLKTAEEESKMISILLRP